MLIPSTPELCVLKALWRQAPLSAREIHEAVEEELAWSFSSTRKTVERMMEKQMVAQHVRHGVQVYEAFSTKSKRWPPTPTTSARASWNWTHHFQ